MLRFSSQKIPFYRWKRLCCFSSHPHGIVSFPTSPAELPRLLLEKRRRNRQRLSSDPRCRCRLIPFSIPYLGHSGSHSRREFQSPSSLLQLLQENVFTGSPVSASEHVQRSHSIICFVPGSVLLPSLWNFCFPSFFTEHPAMQPGLCASSLAPASGHMLSTSVKPLRRAGFNGITAQLCAGIQPTWVFWGAFFGMMCFVSSHMKRRSFLDCLRENPANRGSKVEPSCFWASAAHKRCFCLFAAEV